jgi:hypothetical protein
MKDAVTRFGIALLRQLTSHSATGPDIFYVLRRVLRRRGRTAQEKCEIEKTVVLILSIKSILSQVQGCLG